MLRVLSKSKRHRPSERKFRLFACACCRRIWKYLTDERSRRAVETSERFADSLASEDQLAEAEGDAWDAAGGEASGSKLEAAAWAASDIEAATWNAWEAASEAARNMYREWRMQCRLLRDIIGNPLCPVSISPGWQTPDIANLAQAIYDERSFDRIAELADALEKGGCDNADILAHCRQPGEH